jgi:predicted nucleotidyltransferase
MAHHLLEVLPEDVRETLRSYVKDAASRFAGGLQAIVLYGSAVRGEYLPGRSNLNVMIILTTLELESLKVYAKSHRRWNAERIVVPLFVTESDLETSRDLFPLEYVEMQEHHVLLAGREPFAGRPVDLSRLGMQCQQEIQGNLLRLRQRFVEGGGTIEAIGILLPLSLTALLPCVRGLYRVLRAPIPSGTDLLVADISTTLHIDGSAFQEVWNFKRGVISPGPMEMPRLLERYMSAMEQLGRQLKTMRADGRL